MQKYLHVREDHYEVRPSGVAALLLSGYARLIRWEFPNLAAPFWRWYCNDDWGAEIVIEGKRVSLIPGRVYLIPPHTVFSSRVTRAVRHTFLHFTLDLGYMAAPGMLFSHRPDSFEEKLRRRVVRELRKSEEKISWDLTFAASALINLALETVPRKYWAAQTSHARIEEILRRIREQFPAAIPNKDLARMAGMNVNAFTKWFRKMTGQTPHQFLMLLRVERACQLLQQGNDTLESVAEKTGFYDRFYFSRAFTRYLRVSPARFRKQWQERS